MEVIKKGEIDPTKVYEGECLDCGCITVFSKIEAKKTGAFIDKTSVIFYVECPTLACTGLIGKRVKKVDVV